MLMGCGVTVPLFQAEQELDQARIAAMLVLPSNYQKFFKKITAVDGAVGRLAKQLCDVGTLLKMANKQFDV